MSNSGSVRAYSLYGVPVTGNRPAQQQEGSRIAAPSGPYLGRGNKCSANGDTCKGNRVKGEVLCAGHLRSVRSKMAKAEMVDESVEVDDGA